MKADYRPNPIVSCDPSVQRILFSHYCADRTQANCADSDKSRGGGLIQNGGVAFIYYTNFEIQKMGHVILCMLTHDRYHSLEKTVGVNFSAGCIYCRCSSAVYCALAMA